MTEEIVKDKRELKVFFYHLAPRPIAYAGMMCRYLEMRFKKPEETRLGDTQQLIYRENGTTITFEVHGIGATAKGIEGKVKILFHSNDRESLEKITLEKAWDNFELIKSDIFVPADGFF